MILDRMSVSAPLARAGHRPRRPDRAASAGRPRCSSIAACASTPSTSSRRTRHPDRLGLGDLSRVDRPRRQPARHAEPRARRPGAGPAAGPHVRHAAGRLRHRPRGPAPPPAAHLRRARPRHHHRPRPPPDARDGAGHVGVAEAERVGPMRAGRRADVAAESGRRSLAAPTPVAVAGRPPPTAAVAELLRTLELTINRRLDGVLHGNHQGITPGHGSEPGESRLYQPGDDVRRIDWNVTARTDADPRPRPDRRPRPRGVAGRRRVGGDALRHGHDGEGAGRAGRRRRASASSPRATRTGSARCWSPARSSR